MKRRACLSGMVVMLLGLMSGCYFTSVNPLPPSPALDEKLSGMWQSLPKDKNSQEQSYLLFMPGKGNEYRVVIMEAGYAYSEEYLGHTTEIKGEKYLSLKQLAPQDSQPMTAEKQEYYLVHYRLTNANLLEITLFNEDYLQLAVNSGKIKGVIRKSQVGDDCTLTDSSEKLAQFIATQELSRLLDKESLIKAKRLNLAVAP